MGDILSSYVITLQGENIRLTNIYGSEDDNWELIFNVTGKIFREQPPQVLENIH